MPFGFVAAAIVLANTDSGLSNMLLACGCVLLIVQERLLFRVALMPLAWVYTILFGILILLAIGACSILYDNVKQYSSSGDWTISPLAVRAFLFLLLTAVALVPAEWPFSRGVVRRVLDYEPRWMERPRTGGRGCLSVLLLITLIVMASISVVRMITSRGGWPDVSQFLIALFLLRMLLLYKCPNCEKKGLVKVESISSGLPHLGFTQKKAYGLRCDACHFVWEQERVHQKSSLRSEPGMNTVDPQDKLGPFL